MSTIETLHNSRRAYDQGDPEAFALDEHVFEQADGSAGLGDTPHEAYRALGARPCAPKSTGETIQTSPSTRMGSPKTGTG